MRSNPSIKMLMMQTIEPMSKALNSQFDWSKQNPSYQRLYPALTDKSFIFWSGFIKKNLVYAMWFFSECVLFCKSLNSLGRSMQVFFVQTVPKVILIILFNLLVLFQWHKQLSSTNITPDSSGKCLIFPISAECSFPCSSASMMNILPRKYPRQFAKTMSLLLQLLSTSVLLSVFSSFPRL